MLSCLLLLGSCQALFIGGGKTVAIQLQLDSIVPDALTVFGPSPARSQGSNRLLTADSKTVHLTITTPGSNAKSLYDGDSSVSTNAAGKPSVSVTAPNIPLGIDLVVSATVSNASKVVLLSASRTMNFKIDGSNGSEVLTLVPTADYPGLVSVSATPNDLVVPAGSSSLVSMAISESQIDQNLRLSWSEASRAPTVRVFNASGGEITSTPVLQGKTGSIFAAAKPGTVYATIYNAEATDLTLNGLALKSNISSVSISLGDALTHKVVFSHDSKTLELGDILLVSYGGSEEASGWQWLMDGVQDSSQTGSRFSWDTSGKTPASYSLDVMVTKDGVLYSGSLKLSLVASSTLSWTVTYSSQYASAGKPPSDSASYADGATVTVAGNSGSLSRPDFAFLGWSISGNSSTVIYSPDRVATFNITADTTLNPVWLEIPTKTVSGGKFRRDSNSANISSVAGFAMGSYEVTQAQYVAIAMTTNPSSFAGNNQRPVEQVSWYDALEFCNKLSVAACLTPVYTITGRVPLSDHPITSATVVVDWTANGYRLPTEMEWFWAAMGGNSDGRTGDILVAGGPNVGGYTKGYSGSAESNTGTTNRNTYIWSGASSTGPVGSASANELGIYDLSGNVYEWCWDQWDGTSWPNGLLATWPGMTSGNFHFTKGGGYNDANTALNGRYGQLASYAAPNLGFRVVRGVLPSISYVFDIPGVSSFTLPAQASTVIARVWGAAGSAPTGCAGGDGGFVFSSAANSTARPLWVCVGRGGIYQGAWVSNVPAPAGYAGTGYPGGGGSVVAFQNGSSFELLACAGGGGAGFNAVAGNPGGKNGQNCQGYLVYNGGCDSSRTAPGGSYGGSKYSGSAIATNGRDWIPGATTFAGLGGAGGDDPDYRSGGGGYGGGAGGGDSGYLHPSAGGGSFASGIGSYFTAGLGSGTNDSTLDANYYNLTGKGTNGSSGGHGRVVITIQF